MPVNPITEQEYAEYSPKYKQSLIEAYLNIAKEKYQILEDENKVLQALNEAVQSTKSTGTFHVTGTSLKAKLVRKVNASYPKINRNDEPTLKVLLDSFPMVMKDLVRLEYKEKGSAIDKLLEKYKSAVTENGVNVAELERIASGNQTELQIVTTLASVRVLKPGKPQVSIEDLKEDSGE